MTAASAKAADEKKKSPTTPKPSPATQLLDQVLSMMRTVRRRQDELAKQRGITFLQYSAIQALRRQGSMNVTELAKKLHLKHSTVSKLVDRMERDRLILRVQSSEDLRASKLRLTDLALERVEGLSLSIADFSKRVVGRLAPADQAQLARLVLQLGVAFREELGKLRPLKNEKEAADERP